MRAVVARCSIALRRHAHGCEREWQAHAMAPSAAHLLWACMREAGSGAGYGVPRAMGIMSVGAAALCSALAGVGL